MRHLIQLSALLAGLTGCQAQAPVAPASTSAALAPDLAGDFDARGTEPFWSLQIRPTQLTLQRPDRPNLVIGNPGAQPGADRVSWTLAGEPALSVVILRGDCSDGMSDLAYRYRAEVTVGGERLEGCAFRTAEPPAPPR